MTLNCVGPQIRIVFEMIPLIAHHAYYHSNLNELCCVVAQHGANRQQLKCSNRPTALLNARCVCACVRPLNNDLERFTQIGYVILVVVMFMLLLNLHEYYRLNCVNMNVYINDIVNIKISELGYTNNAEDTTNCVICINVRVRPPLCSAK